MSKHRKQKHSGLTVPAATSALEALTALARAQTSSSSLAGAGYPERLAEPISEHGSSPDLAPAYLAARPHTDFSAACLLDSQMEHGDRLAAMACTVALPHLGRERQAELARAEALRTAPEILAALLADPDTLVQSILIERARHCEKGFADCLLGVLPALNTSGPFEFAALFFAHAEGDYADRLYLAARATTHTYGLATLCLLLGRIDRNEIALRFVWNVYHFMAERWGMPLDQGPLLGLWRYSDRRRAIASSAPSAASTTGSRSSIPQES
jgi:hypothetical protein